MRARVMGVVNVTPDSFSDGGRFFDHEAAIAHGLELFREGADLVDVGGESTRPGAEPVDPTEEQRRVLPVVAELARQGRVSIDTRHAVTAELAIEAGATLLNDVSASLHHVAAAGGAGWVAVHSIGEPRTMQRAPVYADVLGEVRDELRARAEQAVAAGVDEVWVDPGIGFGKTMRHNLVLLAHLDELVDDGFPVVVGTSRKTSLGRLLGASDRMAGAPPLPGFPGRAEDDDTDPVPVDDRSEASLTTAVWAVLLGAAMVRAHDVAGTVQALTLVGPTRLGAA